MGGEAPGSVPLPGVGGHDGAMAPLLDRVTGPVAATPEILDDLDRSRPGADWPPAR